MSVEALDYRSRREPGRARAIMLALAVHVLLIAVIFLGVRWQSHRPETVTVELWETAPPPPPPVVEPPKPVPEPPKVAPEPPKPEPKIEKPVIVEKAPPPKPKPKPEPKAKPKPKPDPQFLKQMQEEAAREQQVLNEQNRLREAREAKTRAAAAASKKALDDWVGKIRTAVSKKISFPQDVPGNPEAIFVVALLPNGEVLDVRLRKSSGHAGLDAALKRAIETASPLPTPVLQRDLELRLRLKDQ